MALNASIKKYPKTETNNYFPRIKLNVNIKQATLASYILAFTGCGVFTNNLHEAVPRTVYRSAQTDTHELEEIIRENGIRTVINLRSANSEEQIAERNACAQLGINYHNIRLSARRAPTKTEVLTLLDTFDQAQTPIHIHCHGGADRTGLAVAAYRLHNGQSLNHALEALDFMPYGHIENGIDEFFEAYRPHERTRTFRQWVEQLPD